MSQPDAPMAIPPLTAREREVLALFNALGRPPAGHVDSNWLEINQHFISRTDEQRELSDALRCLAALFIGQDPEAAKVLGQIADVLATNAHADAQILHLVRKTISQADQQVAVAVPATLHLLGKRS